jgi:predicted MFS family arabinose efflux permease
MNPRVLRLWLARLVSDAGTFCAIFVGIWGKATFRLHATPGEMAVNAAVGGVTAIAGGLAAGVLVDRTDPRRVLLASEALVVPSVLALIIPHTIWTFIAVSAAASFFGGFIMTAVASFAPHIAEDHELPRANIAIEMASSAGMIAGPAIGAVLVKVWSFDGVFVFDAVSSVVAVALLQRMTLRPIPPLQRSRAMTEFREGLRFTFRHRAVRLYVLTVATLWFSFGAFSTLEPLFYREVLHSGPALLGWVLSVFGGGLLAGSMALDRVPRRFLNARTLLGLMLVLAGGQVLYIGTNKLLWVMVGNVIWGVTMGAMGPLARTLIQTATPDRLLGRVTGTGVTLNRGFALLPLTIIGLLAAAFGVQRVLVGDGITLAVLAGIGLLEAARVDAMAAPSPETAVGDPTLAEAAARGLV